ncbi:MAG: pyridoxamine 5'-phosphate oxidase family protein [Saprospiraceae bacterium]|nr:pyridoxamine 5'-phosphate oxidase family protein [Saprospiraceae bacterium]
MILDELVKQAIDESVLCWLATADAKGNPNVSPKEVWTYVNQDIAIANVASPQTLRNIKANPAVCLSFVNVFTQRGFQVKGTAVVLSVKDKYYERYAAPLRTIAGPRFPFAQVFLLKVESVKEILAPSYVFYPEDTDVQSQKEAAYRRYGVEPLDRQ